MTRMLLKINFPDEHKVSAITKTTDYKEIGNTSATLKNHSKLLYEILHHYIFTKDRNAIYPHVNCLSLILLPFFGEAADLLVASMCGHLYFIQECNSEIKPLRNTKKLIKTLPTLKDFCKQSFKN